MRIRALRPYIDGTGTIRHPGFSYEAPERHAESLINRGLAERADDGSEDDWTADPGDLELDTSEEATDGPVSAADAPPDDPGDADDAPPQPPRQKPGGKGKS